jgi:peptide/nickel transport system permease protein
LEILIKKVLYLPIRFFAIIAGVVCVINIPSLIAFNTGMLKTEIHFSQFIEALIYNLTGLTHFNEYSNMINYFTENGNGIHKYVYTMTILSISLVLVVLISLIAAAGIMQLPQSIRISFKSLIDFTTTLPDLLIIFLLQYAVVYLYKTYNFKLFKLYGGFKEEPYFMPIFITIFIPSIFLIQFLLKEFANEEIRDYVLLARAKGLPMLAIYFKHIIRNVLPLMLIHLKTIIWFLLSNIIFVEYLFNIHGYTEVLIKMYGERRQAFIFGLFLFAVPVIIANILAKIVLIQRKRKENSSI